MESARLRQGTDGKEKYTFKMISSLSEWSRNSCVVPHVDKENYLKFESLDSTGVVPLANLLKRKAEMLPFDASMHYPISKRNQEATKHAVSSEKIGNNQTFVLNNFQHVLSLDIGSVTIGHSKAMQLRLFNPSEFGIANVRI